MRIAQVAPLWTSIPPKTYGGIELLVHLMTEEMVRRGHDVTLFASADSQTSARLHPVCERGVIEGMGALQVDDYECYAAAAIAEALRRSADFDVIHCHLGSSKIPLSIASRTPLMHTLHTAIGPDDLWTFKHYPEVAVAAVSAAQVATVPEGDRRGIRVIHNSCDFDAYDAANARGEYLVFLGRMGEHKNPLDAIRTAQFAGMPIILAGTPQNAKEERYFTEQIKPLIDGEKVRYVGSANSAQKRELFKNAAAFLFPTNWAEPCAVAPLEALAAGLPVLAFPNGSVPEIVDYGVTGFYADSAEKLAALVPQALALDRAAVRAHARKRFSHQRMVDEYLDFYGSLIAAKK